VVHPDARLAVDGVVVNGVAVHGGQSAQHLDGSGDVER
jgi:hypothetical protein